MNGEIIASGIKNPSPKTASKKPIGTVNIWRIGNGTKKFVKNQPAIATIIHKSIRMIGMAKNKQAHEYHGRIPSSIDPPAKIK